MWLQFNQCDWHLLLPHCSRAILSINVEILKKVCILQSESSGRECFEHEMGNTLFKKKTVNKLWYGGESTDWRENTLRVLICPLILSQFHCHRATRVTLLSLSSLSHPFKSCNDSNIIPLILGLYCHADTECVHGDCIVYLWVEYANRMWDRWLLSYIFIKVFAMRCREHTVF